MKKLSLAVLGLYIGILGAFSQYNTKDSLYRSRKLTFEEANIVTSYYHQDGNNSAVTGGVGTEKLTDYSNSFEVRLQKFDRRNRKHSLDVEVGVDYYTSASSDKINPATISSASSADVRVYPSINWSRENEVTGTTIGAGVSASAEYDYQSLGANFRFAQKTRDKSGELSVKLQAYLDNLKLIYPIELRPFSNRKDDDNEYASTPRNSYSGSLGYSQIINQRLQVELLADLIYQKGYLGLPFHRIFFYGNTEGIEKLPTTRLKIPLGIRLNYFIGDKIIVRTFYRYYQDDWGLKAHTANIELPIKLSSFFSISPFYRYYTQVGVDYFAPYQQHKTTDQYYTSNYDLSTFKSDFYGAGIRVSPPKGVMGIQHLAALELRYGHYSKNIGMQSDIVTMHLNFK